MRWSMNGRSARTVGAAALVGLVCVLAVAGPAAAGAAAEEPGGEIAPGKGVGPITIGMSMDDLVRLWGPSEQRAEPDQDGVILYDYSAAKGVLVFLRGNRVVQLVVVTPAWSTPNGAKVGMLWPEVRAFLGQPEEVPSGSNQPRYWYKQRGLAFVLKGRTVSAIVVLGVVNDSGHHGFLDELLGKGGGGGGRGQGGR